MSDYEVGYKKPPVRTRFKKRQSGNPSGNRTRSRAPTSRVHREKAKTKTNPITGKAAHPPNSELPGSELCSTG